MKKVSITIDGNTIQVPEGITVLEAAKKLSILIPTFCYHEKLPIFGGCRMCLVWDVKAKRSIIACGTEVYDGMEIETLNNEVFKDRRFILEMLFTRHPLDCPVCDKAGECDLQNWGTYYGPQYNVLPLTPFDKIRPEEDWESDYLEFISNRCVLCIKCISVCDNVNGAHALFQEERGFEIVIAPDEKPMDTESSCEMCGLCVDICPVGAIVFKPFKYRARPWLLEEKTTYCGMCSLQCPVAIDHDEKEIYRIRSTADLMVCSGPYLGYDICKSNRLEGGIIDGEKTTLEEAIKKTADIINENSEKTAVVYSNWSTNESIEALNKIVEKTGMLKTATTTLDLKPVIHGFIEEVGEYQLPTQIDVEKAKRIVVVGDDIANTHPVLSYLFGNIYELGKPVEPLKKEIIFIGEKLGRLKKYFPEIIEVKNEEELLNTIEKFDKFDEGTVIVYSSSYTKGEKAYKIGKAFGKIFKEKGSKILILPVERNAFGVLNNTEGLAYLPEILKRIENGEIENLILIGEEITQHFDEGYLKSVFSKLKNLIVITPFNDGLALSSTVAIGSSLWFEEDGTVEGFRGKKPVRKALKNKTEEREVLEMLDQILQYQPKATRKSISFSGYYDFEHFEKKHIDIWDFGYFSYRSKNLMNWKMKNTLKENFVEEVMEDE